MAANVAQCAAQVVKHRAVPKEARADIHELEAFCLQYMAHRWHIGDPFLELGNAVKMCLPIVFGICF